MNLLGRPNRVCDACHRMKAKCDKRLPSCSRCEARGRPCVYSESDPRFYSMNHWTALNVQSRVAGALAQRSQADGCPLDLSSNSPDQRKLVMQKMKQPLSIPTNIPLLLPLDWSYHAIGPFFDHFSCRSDTLESTWGWLPHLPHIYNNLKGTNSYLVDAVQACALVNLASHVKIGEMENAAFKTYGRALRGLSTALRDPFSLPSDEIVYSVLLLELFESISGIQYNDELFTFHYQGKALILRRELVNRTRSAAELSAMAHINRWLMWRDLAERNVPTLSLNTWPEGLYQSGLDEQSSKYMLGVLEACGRVRNLQEDIVCDVLCSDALEEELQRCIRMSFATEEEYRDIIQYASDESQPQFGPTPADDSPEAISPDAPDEVLSNLECTMLGFSESAKTWMRIQANEKPRYIFTPRSDGYPTRRMAVLWAYVYIGRIHILRAMIDLRLLRPSSQHGDCLPPIKVLRRRLCRTIQNACGVVPFLTSTPLRPNDLLIVIILLHKICDIPGLDSAIIEWAMGLYEWMGTTANLRVALRTKKYQERLMNRPVTGL